MNRLMLMLAIAVATALVVPDVAMSHGGGLNVQGCHNNHNTGVYHCHRSLSEMRRSSSGNYRLRCDLGSQSRDCVGRGTWPQPIRYPQLDAKNSDDDSESDGTDYWDPDYRISDDYFD